MSNIKVEKSYNIGSSHGRKGVHSHRRGFYGMDGDGAADCVVLQNIYCISANRWVVLFGELQCLSPCV